MKLSQNQNREIVQPGQLREPRISFLDGLRCEAHTNKGKTLPRAFQPYLKVTQNYLLIFGNSVGNFSFQLLHPLILSFSVGIVQGLMNKRPTSMTKDKIIFRAIKKPTTQPALSQTNANI
jgi:hypothetical protein